MHAHDKNKPQAKEPANDDIQIYSVTHSVTVPYSKMLPQAGHSYSGAPGTGYLWELISQS